MAPVLLAAFVWIGGALSIYGAVQTQNFDTDPGWTTVGSGANGNNFGYQAASANAGGSVGEAGGTFTRGTTGRIYADTNIGTLSLDQPFSASGKFDFTGSNRPDFGPSFVIGHFLEVGDPLAGDFSQIGIGFGNGGTNNLEWTVVITVGFANGSSIATGGVLTAIDPNIDRTWSYDWNPTGGVNGGGLLTAILSGPGGGTKSLDLTTTQRATLAPASVNAFGLSVSYPTLSDSSEFANVFIDDVAYTVADSSVAPEPSSIAVWSLLSLALIVRLNATLCSRKNAINLRTIKSRNAI